MAQQNKRGATGNSNHFTATRKVINTEKTRHLENEINTMIYTIGAGVGPEFSIEDCSMIKSSS